MSDTTPKLDALLLVDAYQTAHTKGCVALRSTFWDLTKTRREKPGVGASNVRQELTSLVRIEDSSSSAAWDKDDDEPSLKQEVFTLVNVLQQQQDEKENTVQATSTCTATTKDDSRDEGLRNRHGKTDSSSTNNNDAPSTTMTQETVVDQSDLIDPVQLLGGALPPRSLKDAQEHAKRALQAYIQAANSMQELTKLLGKTSVQKEIAKGD